MSVKLDTRTFFFNAKTDFLAYYKNHTISIDESKKIKDLLLEIKALEPIFEFDKSSTLLCINGVSVKGSLEIKRAVELFGTSWTIEPISTFRAVKDLKIDDSDFIEKHSVLEEFAIEDEDFKYYKTLKAIYYASSGLDFDQDYMGDSMFVYAHYLMKKYPDKKADILNAIDKPNGIWLFEKECSMYPLSKNFDEIDAIKSEIGLKPIVGYNEETVSYYDKAETLLCSHFDAKKDEDCALETIIDNIGIDKITSELKHPFSDFNVAFYSGSFECENITEVESEAKKLLSSLGAKVVDFSSSKRADGFDILSYNNEMAYKKAGNILLDAFDSGADILVVDNRESHYIFDQCVKGCEKAVGRDISIPVLNISQITALAVGVTNKEKLGLNEHKIKPEFI